MDVFRPPPEMNFNAGNTAETWRCWEQQFWKYFAAAEVNKKSEKTQMAILLHSAGPDAQDIHKNFVFANAGTDRADNWENILKKFREYCESCKNECYERYKFWQRD